jgi:hypothetical protein
VQDRFPSWQPWVPSGHPTARIPPGHFVDPAGSLGIPVLRRAPPPAPRLPLPCHGTSRRFLSDRAGRSAAAVPAKTVPLTDGSSMGVEDHLIGGNLFANGGRFRRCRMIGISSWRQATELHQAGHQQYSRAFVAVRFEPPMKKESRNMDGSATGRGEEPAARSVTRPADLVQVLRARDKREWNPQAPDTRTNGR